VERFFEGRAAAVDRIVGGSTAAGNEDPAHGPAQHVRFEATLGT
jgi:hypothetical protein